MIERPYFSRIVQILTQIIEELPYKISKSKKVFRKRNLLLNQYRVFKKNDEEEEEVEEEEDNKDLLKTKIDNENIMVSRNDNQLLKKKSTKIKKK